MYKPKIILDEPPKAIKRKRLIAILIYYLIYIPLTVICFVIEGKNAMMLPMLCIIPGISYMMFRKKNFWSETEVILYVIGAYLILLAGTIITMIHFIFALKGM